MYVEDLVHGTDHQSSANLEEEGDQEGTPPNDVWHFFVQENSTPGVSNSTLTIRILEMVRDTKSLKFFTVKYQMGRELSKTHRTPMVECCFIYQKQRHKVIRHWSGDSHADGSTSSTKEASSSIAKLSENIIKLLYL
ncbi:unnamed protein product [Acanthoscelides obtectus]|uniref:Uncharacterized protein n=1 Tax=Acanthoscelides obtectus TaxID=200917 RepID=A0A9P0P071_ACAOB|nr:unnamed protein product [Acanthoscelides obtectus]CAK1646158.1 hypothetical protein AOBTE_LOCUS14485 [Acanthoscelides obtectus]